MNEIAARCWPSLGGSLKALRLEDPLRFLKTLFWIVIAVLITLFAANNWRDVTVDLWGDLQADVKIPVLLIVTFLIGFLPTWLTFRARLWRIENRVSMARDVAPAERAAREEPE